MNGRFGGGDWKVGYMKRRTKVLSIALVRTGVMVIGHKSVCCVGAEICPTCGIGEIEEMGYGFAEGWSSRPEEPGWKSLTSCGCGFEMVE